MTSDEIILANKEFIRLSLYIRLNLYRTESLQKYLDKQRIPYQMLTRFDILSNKLPIIYDFELLDNSVIELRELLEQNISLIKKQQSIINKYENRWQEQVKRFLLKLLRKCRNKMFMK